MGANPEIYLARLVYKDKEYPAETTIQMNKGDKFSMWVTVENNSFFGGWVGVQVWDDKNWRQLAWKDIYMEAFERKTVQFDDLTADKDMNIRVVVYSCEREGEGCTMTDDYG